MNGAAAGRIVERGQRQPDRSALSAVRTRRAGVEADLGRRRRCAGSPGRQVGFDRGSPASACRRWRRTRATRDAPSAGGVEVDEPDPGGGDADGVERDHARRARRRSAEQRLFGKRPASSNMSPTVTIGEDDDDVGLEHRRGEGGAGRAAAAGSSGEQEAFSSSQPPQLRLAVACIISSAPEMTRAFIS